MRRKTTVRNYGKYYETIFVCSNDSIEICNQLSKKLRQDYGLQNFVLDCDDFENLDKKTKKQLCMTYCIIFVLSSSVIYEIEKTFRSDTVVNSELPSFIKMYKYINENNENAIACVIKQNDVLDDDLIYPEYMGDFDKLHRLELTFSDLSMDADNLAYNIRFFYNDNQKAAFKSLEDNEAIKERALEYYDHAEGYVAGGGFLIFIIGLPLFFWLKKNGEYEIESFVFSLFGIIPFFLLNVVKCKINIKQKGIWLQSPYVKNIIIIITKCILYEFLVDCVNSSAVLIIFVYLYFFWFIGTGYFIYAEDEKFSSVLNDTEELFLDYVINLRKYRQKCFVKKLVFVGLSMFLLSFIQQYLGRVK